MIRRSNVFLQLFNNSDEIGKVILQVYFKRFVKKMEWRKKQIWNGERIFIIGLNGSAGFKKNLKARYVKCKRQE